MNNYPTKTQLKTIRNWQGTPHDLWEYLKGVWYYGESAMREKETETHHELALHTLGWSGNEEIIAALQKSKCLFFQMYRTKWERGGHYYFEVGKTLWDVRMEAKQ